MAGITAIALVVLVVDFQRVLGLHMANQTRAIPEHIFLNYKVNLLKGPSGYPRFQKVIKNIDHTLKAHSNMEVTFFDDADCYAAIKTTHSRELADFYKKETFGAYKSDLCRLAQLAERGGYYFDNDIEVIQDNDIRNFIPAEAAFVSVQTTDTEIFQAVLAAAPNHPVIMRAMNLTFEHYMKKRRRAPFVGPRIMAEAFKWWSGEALRAGAYTHDERPDHLRHSFLLKETPDYASYGLQRRGGRGCCCNFLVGVEETKTAVFYSRYVGAGKHCH